MTIHHYYGMHVRVIPRHRGKAYLMHLFFLLLIYPAILHAQYDANAVNKILAFVCPASCLAHWLLFDRILCR